MGWIDIIKIVLPILGGILVGWRVQLVGKRKFELAETALLHFSMAHQTIRAVRSPGSYSYEGEERPPRPDESESVAKRRNTYYVPIARLQKNKDVFAPLEKDALLVRYHFGASAEQSFKELREVYHQIVVASGMLIDLTGDFEPPTEDTKNFRREMEQVIWGGYREDDKIDAKLNEALTRLETALSPALDAHYWYRPATLKRLLQATGLFGKQPS